MFEYIKKHKSLLALTVLAIIAALIATIWYKPSSRRESVYILPSRGYILPFLTIQVSPPGYPEFGESWRISVYLVNATKDGEPIYQPACNASVFVTVLSGYFGKIFELTTNEDGETSFPYNSQNEVIDFQANYSTLSSEKVIISGSFVSSNIVDTLLMFNIFSLLGSLGSDLVLKPEKSDKLSKWKNLARAMLICVFSLFSFVTLTCIYVKLFQGTGWGYRESIVGNCITFTSLSYIFYAAILLFFLFWVLKLVIRGLDIAQ